MKYCFYLIIIICSISCRGSKQSTMPDDETMERLREIRTDSMAKVLEDINISTFNKEEKMNYAWWLTRLHFMQRRNLINDTLIHEALEYYKEQKSPRIVYSYLLAAEQINSLGNKNDEQAELYEKALEASDLYNDTCHNDYIIRQLMDRYAWKKDYGRVRELLELLKQNKPIDIINYTSLIGVYSLILSEPDSLSKYAKEAIELARKQDKSSEYEITRMYIEGLNNIGRHQEALKILKDLEKRVKVNEVLKLNYISTYIGMNRMDSARHYMQLIKPFIIKHQGNEEADVLDLILSSYQMIIDVKEGKPISLNTIGLPGDKILHKTRNRIRADRERQFAQNKLLEQNLNLDIERGKMKQRILWAGILVIIIAAIIIYIYQRKLLTKERTIQQAKEQLRLRSLQLTENEQIIHRNEEMIKTLSSHLEDENNDLKEEIDQLSESNRIIQQENNNLLKDINNYLTIIDQKDHEVMVYDKLVQENERLSERESYLVNQLIGHTKPLAAIVNKPHYIDTMQWPEILHAINQLFNGFTYRLHTDFPGLNDEDIKYCCLIKLRLSNSVIAILTGISPSSVTKRKQRIKEKMGQYRHLTEIRKDQSLEIYLWNY